MTTTQARRWIIMASLIITGVQLVFLLLAPAIGVPLAYPKNLDILQIVLPVFLGYLGSAAHFVFRYPVPAVPVHNEFLGLMVRGPIIIYALAMIAAFGAFIYSNRPGAPLGSGMSVANLGTAVSIVLGVLAVTTGVIISYLFVTDQKEGRASAVEPAPRPAASTATSNQSPG